MQHAKPNTAVQFAMIEKEGKEFLTAMLDLCCSEAEAELLLHSSQNIDHYFSEEVSYHSHQIVHSIQWESKLGYQYLN